MGQVRLSTDSHPLALGAGARAHLAGPLVLTRHEHSSLLSFSDTTNYHPLSTLYITRGCNELCAFDFAKRTCAASG